jgi:AmpE protein
MTIFITLVLALLIEHIFWNASTWRQGDWFTTYYQKIIGAKSLARFSHLLANAGWLLVPLILVVGMLQFVILPELGSLLAWLFGLAALLFCFGPRNIGRDIEDYLQAKSAGQTQQASRIASYFATSSSQPADTDSQVNNGLLVQANQSLIGPIFGFILLGAMGAVLYRAIQHLAKMQTTQQGNSSLAQSTGVLVYWINWLPARITVLGYAAVGHFEAVVSAWKHQEQANSTSHATLLIATGQAALADHKATGRASIVAHWTLVKRIIILWTTIIGAIAFFSAF